MQSDASSSEAEYHPLPESAAVESDARGDNNASLDMHFLPTDASRLLVATDLPGVLQRSRYSPEPPSPEAFAPEGS